MTELEKLKAAYNAARASTAWDALVDAPALHSAYATFNASAAALREAITAAIAAQKQETPNE
jgi:hypothetical protein